MAPRLRPIQPMFTLAPESFKEMVDTALQEGPKMSETRPNRHFSSQTLLRVPTKHSEPHPSASKRRKQPSFNPPRAQVPTARWRRPATVCTVLLFVFTLFASRPPHGNETVQLRMLIGEPDVVAGPRSWIPPHDLTGTARCAQCARCN